MQNYHKLLKQDSTCEIWALAMCKELLTLFKGYKGIAEVTNTFFFMSLDNIRDIPPDKTVTYACIVVDYMPQKADPNCVRLTVGGNLLNVPGYLNTTTADITISKILWNSVLSKKYVRFAFIDIKNMYIQNPITDYKNLGGTYAPTTYQRFRPDVTVKHSTFGSNLRAPQTTHPFLSLQTMTNPLSPIVGSLPPSPIPCSLNSVACEFPR